MKRLHPILFAFALASAASADTVSLGEAHGPPTGVALVPVLLETTTPLAGVELRVNFDPRHLTFLDTMPGTDATGFNASTRQDPSTGQLLLAITRSQALMGFSGELLQLRFEVNSGSRRGNLAEITIAQATFVGEFGQPVGGEPLIMHGAVEIAFSMFVDTDGDGISDYEEQFHDGLPGYNPYHPQNNPTGTDTDVTVADTDQDGINDGDEIIAGTDPVNPADVLKLRLDVHPPSLWATWDARPGVHYRLFATDTLGSPMPGNLLHDNLQPPTGPYSLILAPPEAAPPIYYRLEAFRPPTAP